jgi:predicted tellurium resistance membrane protein TerC
MIMSYFAVPEEQRQKVLIIGILVRSCCVRS